MLIRNIIAGLIIFCAISGCHPCYKRLTRGNWEKDTVWVRFPDLPKPIYDTLIKNINLPRQKQEEFISFDPAKQFTDMGYYDAYSDKLRLPFGQYFKLGRKKYFIHYSQLRSPIIFYENSLYFPSGKFFQELTDKEKYDDKNWDAFKKAYYVRYKLKK